MTTTDKPKEPEALLDLAAIADLLGVAHRTATTWRTRGVLPPPDFTISNRPGWRRATILRWARKRTSTHPRAAHLDEATS